MPSCLMLAIPWVATDAAGLAVVVAEDGLEVVEAQSLALTAPG